MNEQQFQLQKEAEAFGQYLTSVTDVLKDKRYSVSGDHVELVFDGLYRLMDVKITDANVSCSILAEEIIALAEEYAVIYGRMTEKLKVNFDKQSSSKPIFQSWAVWKMRRNENKVLELGKLMGQIRLQANDNERLIRLSINLDFKKMKLDMLLVDKIIEARTLVIAFWQAYQGIYQLWRENLIQMLSVVGQDELGIEAFCPKSREVSVGQLMQSQLNIVQQVAG